MIRAAWMEKIMSKTNDTERTRELEAERELTVGETDQVSGGWLLGTWYALAKALPVYDKPYGAAAGGCGCN
jgi:hypothetical protein